MKNILLQISLISFLLIAERISAQPDWSVIPSDFEFTMTVTGVVVIECEESADEQDLVAAFINGEVRGVQPLNTSVGERRYAYMIVYENDFEGNEITFKIYDASQDSIYDARQTVLFEENGIAGTEGAPFIFNTSYNLIETFLSQDSIEEFAIAGDAVAELQTINELEDTLTLSYSFINDDFGPDNHYFTITDSLLILNEDVNAFIKDSYRVHVASTASDGCGRDDVYTLFVTGQGTTATDDAKHVSDEILFYPNPATTSIQFATRESLDKVLFYSAEGTLIHMFRNVSTSAPLDISAMQPGLYFIQFYVNGMKTIEKLIVQ